MVMYLVYRNNQGSEKLKTMTKLQTVEHIIIEIPKTTFDTEQNKVEETVSDFKVEERCAPIYLTIPNTEKRGQGREYEEARL